MKGELIEEIRENIEQCCIKVKLKNDKSYYDVFIHNTQDNSFIYYVNDKVFSERINIQDFKFLESAINNFVQKLLKNTPTDIKEN